MLDKKKRILLLGMSAILLVLAYQNMSGAAEDASKKNGPAKIEEENGVKRITLTPKAAERLGIQTSRVQEAQVDASGEFIDPDERSDKHPVQLKRIIPYAAVLYDINGNAWAYVSPEPNVFIRHRLIVDQVDDNYAILSEGPPTDTEVVTVGVAELYGTEKKIGK